MAIIGVTVGLLTTELAVLSLIGMQLKNGIVLVEEIKRLSEELLNLGVLESCTRNDGQAPPGRGFSASHRDH